MILVRFFGFEVPTQTRGYNDRNFKIHRTSEPIASRSISDRCQIPDDIFVSRRSGSGPANLAQSCPLGAADRTSFEPSEHFR
jgi:hypothetical protein